MIDSWGVVAILLGAVLAVIGAGLIWLPFAFLAAGGMLALGGLLNEWAATVPSQEDDPE